MTKEEKLELELYQACEGGNFKSVLEKFFESNICIPKGENRHPYADVLHEFIEGTKIECRYIANTTFEWKDNITLPSIDFEYRIKPSDPIYEYLFYSPEGSTKWMTIKESEIDVYFIQAKETKRERK